MRNQPVQSLLSHITPAYRSLLDGGADVSEYVKYMNTDDITDLFISPLYILISIIPYMPYKLRKFILDYSRIQSPISVNKHLSAGLQDLRSHCHSGFFLPEQIRKPLVLNCGLETDRHNFTISDLLPILDTLYDNPIGLSILSYFVRAETTIFPDEFITIGNETIGKEISASLRPNVQQTVDYRGIFTEEKLPLHEGVSEYPVRTAQLWKTQLHRITTILSRSDYIIFPHYNKRKNVSYSTQTAILSFLNDHSPILDQPTDYTSLTLLQIYHEYGVQVEGHVELRSAWKFNDLKPRGYYCLGGRSFWAATYIKDFTKQIQETMMSTHPFSRFDIARITPVQDNQIVITYDYSTFTTSLAELKYFLWYLASHFSGTKVKILDVYLGVIEIDFGEYLHDYNKVVNMHQIVDLARLLKIRTDENTLHYQGRSGSLGVGGNIGLSTACHGLSICAMTDTPDEDSIVGDDALIKILAESFKLFIVIINKLGDIHPEKISTFSRPPFDQPQFSQVQGFKYLKRPLTVDSYGSLVAGFLDFFPNLGVCLRPNGDGIHSQRAETVQDILKTFCMQWGRYLTIHTLTPSSQDLTVEDDIKLILACVQTVYSRYGLPYSGCLPFSQFFFASSFTKDDVFSEVNFWVPPCESDNVFNTHWLDILFSTFKGRDMNYPIEVGGEIPPPRVIYPGFSFSGTQGKLITLLEDLGYLETKIEIMRTPFDSGILQKAYDTFRGQQKEKVLYSIYVVNVPKWYDEVHNTLYPLPTLSGPHGSEARDEISTLWDGYVDSSDSEEEDFGFAE